MNNKKTNFFYQTKRVRAIGEFKILTERKEMKSYKLSQ